MSVSSRDIPFSQETIDRARTERHAPPPDPTTRIAVGVAVLIFGGLQWLVGARWTVDGWVDWLNMFARWVGLGVALPRLVGPALIGAALVVGWLYSRVEIQAFPIRRIAGGWARLTVMGLVGWLFLSGTDVGSTYAGLTHPPADALPLWRDVAQRPPIAAIVSFYFTFAPDWIILGALRMLWRR